MGVMREGITHLVGLLEELSLIEDTLRYVRKHLTASDIVEISSAKDGVEVMYRLSGSVATGEGRSVKFGKVKLLLRGDKGKLRVLSWDVDGMERFIGSEDMGIKELEKLIRGT